MLLQFISKNFVIVWSFVILSHDLTNFVTPWTVLSVIDPDSIIGGRSNRININHDISKLCEKILKFSSNINKFFSNCVMPEEPLWAGEYSVPVDDTFGMFQTALSCLDGTHEEIALEPSLVQLGAYLAAIGRSTSLSKNCFNSISWANLDFL